MGKIKITAGIIMLAITTAFLFTMQACTMTESKPPTTDPPHGADEANIIQDSSYGIEPVNILQEIVTEEMHEFRVNESMPTFECAAYISGSEYNKQITQIVITDKSSGDLIQIITPQDSELYTKSAVYFIDVTFDGNIDILIPFERSARSITVNAYVWNEGTKKFVESPSFREIANPAIDGGSEQILSVCSMLMGSMSYSMYSYTDDRFVRTNAFDWHNSGDPHFLENEAITVRCEEHSGDFNLGNVTNVNEFYTTMHVYDGLDKSGAQIKPYFEAGSFWDLDNPKWACLFFSELAW